MLSLGNLQRLAGRPDDAVRTLREALKRFEEMRYETKVALAQADLGRLLFDMGQAGEGRLLLDRARETQEKIAARGGFANVLPDTYTTLGNIHEAEGRPNEALSFYEKAKAMYEEFAAQTPTVYMRTELARALNNLGLVRAEAGLQREGQRDVERGRSASGSWTDNP